MEKRKRKTKKQKHEEHVKFMDELRNILILLLTKNTVA